VYLIYSLLSRLGSEEEPMSRAEERRRSPRYEFNLRLLFRKQDSAYFYETRTENISADGVFLHTRHQKLDVGTPVLVMLSGPEFGGSIPIQGRVVRLRDESGDMEGPPGMAISFEGIAEDKRQILSQALERVAAEQSESA